MNTIELLSIISTTLLGFGLGAALYLIIRFGNKLGNTLLHLLQSYTLTERKHQYQYMAAFYDEVYNFITQQETRLNIQLTEEARQMLVLPLVDIQRINNQRLEGGRSNDRIVPDLESWRKSVTSLLENMRDAPARVDKTQNQLRQTTERTSLSVVKAYANKFCNIPPFCGES